MILLKDSHSVNGFKKWSQIWVCVCVSECVSETFLPPGEQVSGGGVLVMFRGLEPQLEGEEPRILTERHRWLP